MATTNRPAIRTRMSLVRTSAIALLLSVALVVAGSVAASGAEPPSPAHYLQRDDSVVTADALPTVQIDSGYVWAQTTIGNTVYAAGSFSNARAPLANPGTGLTPRSNILAYDITTGGLLPFAPQVNGVIKSIAASPDGSRIYIGGSFNQVNGQPRWGLAALDAATGELVPGFSPAVGGTGVFGVAVTQDTVYVAGLFTQANGVARKNLAAFATSNGSLRPWAPTTDLQADAIVVEPGGANIVVGGRFGTVNGAMQRGLAALDPSSGAVNTAWLAPKTVVNGIGTGGSAGKAGIFTLATDAGGVYGTGWVYADASVGNLEGVFAAEAGSGAIRWISDCHGDHYGVYSTGETVYSTSHTHACETVGLWPEQSPRQYRYVEAYTATAEGVLTRSATAGGTYKDWSGTPSPAAYSWFPDFTVGTATGLGQAGLSITGAGDYISVAGEFGSVNNQRFQGLVRFSTNPAGGAKDRPRLDGTSWATPSASSVVAGRVRVTVPANWDRDDRDLTYQLIRAGAAGVADSEVVASGWWNRPSVTLQETGLAPGQSYTYTVRAVDGDGNAATSPPVTVTVAGGTTSDYVDAVLDDGATLYYPLGNISGDWAGTNAPVSGGGVSSVSPGAVAGVTGERASAFNGSTGRVSTTSSVAPSNAYSLELWFKTTTTRGGKLIGFGNRQTGSSGSYDRHVYMTNNGRLTFGIYPGATKTVSSSRAYNDGSWHHLVATQGSAGMALYVDGAIVAQDPTGTSAESYSGYWRIGGDSLGSWPDAPSSNYFSGTIDEVAVYGSPLSAEQVSSHYATGLGITAPTASFDVEVDDLTASFDASASTAEDGHSIASYAWSFGDGTPPGTGATPTHVYEDAGDYTVTLTVTDDRGMTGAVSTQVTVVGPNEDPTASFVVDAEGLTASVNAAAAEDPDGDIVGYSWDWGDGSPAGDGVTATHRYEAPGEYDVTLTVTDDRGGQATATRQVAVSHADPVASFDVVAAELGVTADASASTASDGATLSYAWDWGDGSPAGSGATASHDYGSAGDYTITLTVTDSIGASATAVRAVSVSETGYAARDDFERSVASGWGAADVGGAWSAMHGSASAGSVSEGQGVLTLSPGQTRNMAAQSLAVADSLATVVLSLDQAPATGGSYAGIATRQSASGDYTARVWLRSDGRAWLVVQRGGTVLATQALSLTWAAGDRILLSVQTTGADPTTIRAKAWKEGAPEPADWQISATDSTAALQGTGWVSLHASRGGAATSIGVFAFDRFRVQDLTGSPTEENAEPTAAFAVDAAGLRIDVDGGASSDEDGEIAEFRWDWGDGTEAGSGATAAHEYAEPGTYTVTLTVTDDDGAEGTATQDVSVTAPEDPENVPPAAAFTSSLEGLVLSADASESTDEDGEIVEYGWDWGDGTEAGTGAIAVHEYASEGTFTVTLTVTDDGGATDTATQEVVVASEPPAEEFAARDDFGRSVATGWGTADGGGPWTVVHGSASAASVSDGGGRIALAPGSTRNLMLNETVLRDVSMRVDFSLDRAPDTGGSYVGLVARAAGSDNYTVRVWMRTDGRFWLVFQRGSTVLKTQPVTDLAWQSGTTYTLQAEVSGAGTTTLSAKVWPAGTPAPAGWQGTVTDAAGLAAGAVGVHANRSGAATAGAIVGVDGFRVADLE